MITCGIGGAQVNGLLDTMNIPGITHTKLKKREREVGETLCKTAEESCRKSLEKEASL